MLFKREARLKTRPEAESRRLSEREAAYEKDLSWIPVGRACDGRRDGGSSAGRRPRHVRSLFSSGSALNTETVNPKSYPNPPKNMSCEG